MRPHARNEDAPSSQRVHHISPSPSDSRTCPPAGPEVPAPPSHANICSATAPLPEPLSEPSPRPQTLPLPHPLASSKYPSTSNYHPQASQTSQASNPVRPKSNLTSTPESTTISTAQKAAQPSRAVFDPWNSSSTGHQRAENRLASSTSWRASRNLKLSSQFRAGLSGGHRVADTVGAGSEAFGKDGRMANGGWERGASGLRGKGQRSLVEFMGVGKGNKAQTTAEKDLEAPHLEAAVEGLGDEEVDSAAASDMEMRPPTQRQIFQGLCFYVNGSTAPLVSDHKLKRLLAERGATTSIALGRRSVTHVILGTANGQGGAGGGLSGSKIQKEIARVGGKGVKFVGVEWILESIKADKRLPEARFSTLKIAPKGQNSVYGLAKKIEERRGDSGD